MTKYEDDEPDAAATLEHIRTLMDRATEYSHLSGVSILLSGALCVAGVGACAALGVGFDSVRNLELLAQIWSAVFLAALLQGVGLSVLNARRKAEPAWSPLTYRVVLAMVPAAFTGASLSAYAFWELRPELLPPFWMLSYGSSLMGLGLFAGRRIQATALLFLLSGAAALFGGARHGLLLMLVSFGGYHLLLGAWILWKPRASAV